MGSVVNYLIQLLRLSIDLFCYCYATIFWPPQKGRIPPVDEPILLRSATELADRVRKGQLKCEDVVNAFIRRIKATHPLINAVIDTRYEGALEEARALDERVASELLGEPPQNGVSVLDLPLLGVPFSIKDSLGVTGLRMPCGLMCRKDVKATEDAEVVTNLRKAGAIPIAVTNVPELLMWWSADNLAFGRTNNPYDLSRISGGSSGGEGALISSAGTVFGVGTDIGGSIRIPANFCGIFGHKTTSRTISVKGKYPPVVEGRQRYFSVGPMARYARDLIPMLKAMAGDRISELPNLESKVDLRKLRVFYLEDDEDPFKTRVNQDIKQSIRAVAQHLSETYKVETKAVSLTEFKMTAIMWFSALKEAEGTSMTSLMNDRKSESNVYLELVKSFLSLSSHTRSCLIFALSEKLVPSVESNFVQKGLKLRDTLTTQMRELLGDDGILLLPSHPEPAPKHGTTVFKVTNIGYTTILNILGLPATQCPIGLNADGLPLGIQVAACPYNDHLTLAVAQEIETKFGGWVPPFQVTC